MPASGRSGAYPVRTSTGGTDTTFRTHHCRIIPPKGHPVEPRFLGEHIRKRRLGLGLLQIEVTATIGVSENTVSNWEHGTEPELIHIPAVLAFLGYVPWECPGDPVDRLAHFKKVKGLSLRRLGAQMGRDPEQLEDWLSGRVNPCRRNMQEIRSFLQKTE
ncbi:MAG: helix-turn-helix domain-containing protein [Nitrospirae bacterium]|nr:helix-turn-helix domain-containing protein [Nitrospirota bacterium]